MAATVLSDEVTLFFVSHALCDIVISAVEDCSLTTGSSTKVVCCFSSVSIHVSFSFHCQ